MTIALGCVGYALGVSVTLVLCLALNWRWPLLYAVAWPVGLPFVLFVKSIVWILETIAPWFAQKGGAK